MCEHEENNCAQRVPRGEAIARLNDELRIRGNGGRILVTSGVRALKGYHSAAVLTELAAYDDFDADNDPHGERDFGDLDFDGSELLWKIDYYDTTLEYGSPDPADPTLTTRVLIVMLAEEY